LLIHTDSVVAHVYNILLKVECTFVTSTHMNTDI